MISFYSFKIYFFSIFSVFYIKVMKNSFLFIIVIKKEVSLSILSDKNYSFMANLLIKIALIMIINKINKEEALCFLVILCFSLF